MADKILLVDDNADFMDNMKDLLEDEGYQVVTAACGEEAVALVESDFFALVLMDIRMPGMNGVESFLKMKAYNPGVRVILLTAYALNDLIQAAQDSGVLTVLKKPLDMTTFIKTIEEAIKTSTGGTILVTDDDSALCDNLKEVLTACGYKVAVAFDGAHALHEAKMQVFDVLLLDLKLPELDGLEVYRRIRTLQPHLVTILITGYAEEMKGQIRQAIRENAYTFLPKPLEMKNLISVVHEAMEARNNGPFSPSDSKVRS